MHIFTEEDWHKDYADFCGDYSLNFSDIDYTKAVQLGYRCTVYDPKLYFDICREHDDNFQLLAQCVMWLFSEHWISRAQIATWLEFIELRQEFDVEVVALMDDEGRLTSAAIVLLQYFLPLSAYKKFINALKEQPFSERFCFKIFGLDNLNEKHKELLNLVKDSHVMHVTNKTGYWFSKSIRDIIAKLLFGPSAKQLFPRLGRFTIDDIERSVRAGGRYSAMPCFDIPLPPKFHNIESTPFFLIVHDELHRNYMSRLPEVLYVPLIYAIDKVREITGIYWSYEIWQCFDMGFSSDFYSRKIDTPKLITNNFFKLLSYDIELEGDFGFALCNPSPYIDTMWLLLIDMVVNAKHWSQFKINLNLLNEDSPYLDYYQHVMRHKKDFIKIKNFSEQVCLVKATYFELSSLTVFSACFEKEAKTNCIQLLINEKALLGRKAILLDIVSEVNAWPTSEAHLLHLIQKKEPISYYNSIHLFIQLIEFLPNYVEHLLKPLRKPDMYKQLIKIPQHLLLLLNALSAEFHQQLIKPIESLTTFGKYFSVNQFLVFVCDANDEIFAHFIDVMLTDGTLEELVYSVDPLLRPQNYPRIESKLIELEEAQRAHMLSSIR